MLPPRVVLVTRRTELDSLLDSHGTRGQAEFVLRSRGQSLRPLVDRHERTYAACRAVLAAVPAGWRRAEVERAELPRFVFEPGDIVVVLGQDGLVANAAKYLDVQPVVGVDPVPGEHVGVLVPHPVPAVADLLADVAGGRAAYTHRTLAQVTTDDGQRLEALNEIFVGQPGHQSSRYELSVAERSERQSSSGVIVGTGTGASGWCASLHRVLAPGLSLPRPDEAALAWFVREAWPSATTGVTMVAGRLAGPEVLDLRAASDQLVAFGDGVELDRLLIGGGQRVTLGLSARSLRTVA